MSQLTNVGLLILKVYTFICHSQDGKTALQKAKRFGHLDLIKMLESYEVYFLENNESLGINNNLNAVENYI